MSYDGYGNIHTKNGKAYTYGNSVWNDLLTSYGGQAISYDAQGNPTSYLGHTLTWEKGRQLKSFDSNAYTYNASGIRMTKTVGGVKHTYTLDGTKIIREVWGSNTLFPLYGVDDSVCGINYNGNYYYFAKNLQGDIIAIVDKDAKTVARYSYDAWGVPTVVSDSSGRSIATVNPFRYRGYYYDAEIGMYYLQSRYYNPVVGRFINADDAKIIKQSSASCIISNLFSYCMNEPVKQIDPLGYLRWPGEIHRYVQTILSIYIWAFLGCYTYIDYFIRFSAFKYGFADLYAKRWNEIWEVKPEGNRYLISGPKQLAKYLQAIKGSKAGRNLGNYTTYYFSDIGFYQVKIRSDTNDGMIYYSYDYCWKVNAFMLLAITSIVLICTGVGAGAGAAGLSSSAAILVAA